MKKLILILAALSAFAQSPHSVTLNWTDTKNPAGTTYSIYRAPGLCSGTPTFAKIATGLATKTYLDASVVPGNYCYAATANLSGMESAQSVSVPATILPDAPTNLTITVQ